STAATWNSIVFDLSGSRLTSTIARITIFTEPLASGAALDVTMLADYGLRSVVGKQIAYSKVGGTKTKHVVLRDSIQGDNLQLQLSWANGSTTNPVKVRKIVMSGTFTEFE